MYRILSWAMQKGGCRRNSLLSLIGQAPVACSGCDVCNGSAASRAEGERELLSFIARHRRRSFHDCIPGCGGLGGWVTHEAVAALHMLVWQGRLRILCRGPWKGRLTVAPPTRPCYSPVNSRLQIKRP